MRVIFLSEYYLRTKDVQIIPGIQAAYDKLMDCAKSDYMARHKVTYKRPMRFNSEFSHSNNFNLRRLQLKLRVAPPSLFKASRWSSPAFRSTACIRPNACWR